MLFLSLIHIFGGAIEDMSHHSSYIIGCVNKLAQRCILAAGVILATIFYPALKVSVGDIRTGGEDDGDQLEQIVQCGIGVAGIIFDFVISVSYTHLDVYKRQGKYGDASSFEFWSTSRISSGPVISDRAVRFAPILLSG